MTKYFFRRYIYETFFRNTASYCNAFSTLSCTAAASAAANTACAATPVHTCTSAGRITV